MANPLSDLWQKLMSSVFTNSSSGPTVKTDPTLPTAGKYQDEGTLHSVMSSLMPGVFHPGGTIRVNPANTASVARTIQHEKVHALLSPLNADGTLDKLNNANPYYKSIAPKILLDPGGDASVEAPAYTATGESSQMGIDPTVAKKYTTYLQQQLQQINPSIAKSYAQLSQ
jgi:hypothetical protein